jgi:hypothetical protein
MGGILWSTWARYGCPLLCARFKLSRGKPGRAIYENKKIEFVALLLPYYFLGENTVRYSGMVICIVHDQILNSRNKSMN